MLANEFIDYAELIKSGLPSTLRQLYLYENANKFLHPGRVANRPSHSLSRALSQSSISLWVLSAAFLVEANVFFSRFRSNMLLDPDMKPWENLRVLGLTSCLLYPRERPSKINDLLTAAGRAACLMPKLELMELWNAAAGNVCIFRYKYNAGVPLITWSNNWSPRRRFELDDGVIWHWSNLPRLQTNPRCSITVKVDWIPWSGNEGNASTSWILKLETGVVQRVSNWKLKSSGSCCG